MDPTGGLGLKLLIALVVLLGLLWWLAPAGWALGISIVLIIAFIAFIVAIFSSTRFT